MIPHQSIYLPSHINVFDSTLTSLFSVSDTPSSSVPQFLALSATYDHFVSHGNGPGNLPCQTYNVPNIRKLSEAVGNIINIRRMFLKFGFQFFESIGLLS